MKNIRRIKSAGEQAGGANSRVRESLTLPFARYKMNKIIYRNATIKDALRMKQLWRKYWPPQKYEDNLVKKIRNDKKHVIVAEYNHKIIGTIIGGNDGWWQWIYRVSVDPEYTNKGIAKNLLKKMHNIFKNEGVDYVCLFTSKNNKRMIKLIENIGYEKRNDIRYSKKI